MAEREYGCRQRNQNPPVSKPRRIYVFVEAALKKRIVRDVVVNLSVVTEAVLETVEVLAFKLWRQRIPIAAAEERGPISTVIVVDR